MIDRYIGRSLPPPLTSFPPFPPNTQQVKLIAVNDSFILESNVFQVLRQHFGHEPFYPTLFDLFREVTTQYSFRFNFVFACQIVSKESFPAGPHVHPHPVSPYLSSPSPSTTRQRHRTQVTLQTELGQLLDLTSQPMDGKIDLNRFTLERYRLIVKYKTAFYTFYLPIVRISAAVSCACAYVSPDRRVFSACLYPDRINLRGRSIDHQPASQPARLSNPSPPNYLIRPAASLSRAWATPPRWPPPSASASSWASTSRSR